jgi:hypothetical protein
VPFFWHIKKQLDNESSTHYLLVMIIKVAAVLESILWRAEKVCVLLRERVALCPDCGRNRYTGGPCK